MSATPAGDTSPEPEAVRALFFVTAEAEPGLAPRLLEPFAKLGLTPSRVHLSSEDGAGDEIAADIRVAQVPLRTAHLIDKALRRITGVRSVIALVE